MGGPLFDESVDEPRSGKGGIPPEWDARVRSELRRGERLLWFGRPRPRLFARQALPVVAFGILWSVIPSTMLVIAVLRMRSGRAPFDEGDSISGLIFLLLFESIGLALISAPYWMLRKARRTCYALTDRRAILWEAASFGSLEVRSYGPEDLNLVYRVEYPGGGDLVLEEVYAIRRDNDGERTTHTKHGFMGIEDVREVEELLRKALLADDV